ncbi:MAG: CRISPR-associated endonuclease Cas1 [Spirosomataceae bacterium]
MQLLFASYGLIIKKRNNRFLVIDNGKEFSVSPRKLTSVAITTHCFVSTSALRLAIDHQLPVFFMDELGNVIGRVWSPSFAAHSRLRRQQVYFADSPEAVVWVKQLFDLKTEQQLQNLGFLQNRKPGYAADIHRAMEAISDIRLKVQTTAVEISAPTHQAQWQSLLGLEGSMARHYWQTIAECFADKGLFDGRSRRPATDAFNCALNYLYGMLYTTTESALFAAGLDPYLGVLHTDGYDSASLSFDLIEPFRPWADRFLLEKMLRGEFEEGYFDKKENNGFWLNKAGKKWLIPAFNEYMNGVEPFLHWRKKRTDTMYEYAGMLRKIIEHFEKP